MMRLNAVLLSMLVSLLACLPAVGAEAPKFAPVKAELIQRRGGIGNVMAKLRRGAEVRIAYLGGSITAARGWRPKSLRWFQQAFPTARVSEIHAAIGGTGSDLGVFRVGRDVLAHKPDLLFVEFAVNDGGADPANIWRAMEGIVRQTWAAEGRCDIVFVYTFREGYEKDLDAGYNPRAASAMEMLAEHYQIPSINFAMRIAERVRQGTMVIRADAETPGKTRFSKDGVHPLDEAHGMYAALVGEAVEAMRDAGGVDHGVKLKRPFVADHWQAAKLVPITPSMLDGEWEALPESDGKSRAFGTRLGTIWHAATPGATLRVKFRGSVAKLYDLVGPDGGQVDVTVDGKSHGPVARFDSYCTYHRISTLGLVSQPGESAVHEVVVRLRSDQPDRTIVTDKVKDQKGFDPRKYDGTNLWVGGVLILGEIVE